MTGSHVSVLTNVLRKVLLDWTGSHNFIKTWPQTCTKFEQAVRSNFMIFWQCYLEPKMKLTVFLFF